MEHQEFSNNTNLSISGTKPGSEKKIWGPPQIERLHLKQTRGGPVPTISETVEILGIPIGAS